jgi:UPF0755 protein
MKVLLWSLRLGLLFMAVTGCLTAAFVLYGRWLSTGQGGIRIEGGSPNLSAAEQLYLQTYLSLRAEQLQQPAGTGVAPISFAISPGETADVIAANLVEAGLLSNPELFLNYARYYGLDAKLEAGHFTLNPQLTIPELVAALTRGLPQEIELRFLEGWRMEEMANYLAVTTPGEIDPADFLVIARRQRELDLSRYDFLASLPADASLEGFLFPDTYRVPTDATAPYLVDLMLQNFGRQVTPALRQSFGVQQLSLHEAVTLASIVEREAVLPEERPLIAGVFYNRLAQGMPLQADPTVQFALGYQDASGTWWKTPLSLTDLQLDSPYNTYIVPSLPPGPIANPSLSSLQAVAEPAQTNFLYFVADCTADVAGKHAFSVTFEEHLAHVERCQ